MTETEAEAPPTPEPDVLAPWGPDGPPSPGEWSRDVLGDSFEVKIGRLLPDDEGEVFASLVRYLPPPHQPGLTSTTLSPTVVPQPDAPEHPHFALLYLHGRNDYFFQRELAHQITVMGGAFYALDLRKYGRSLRPWQTIGYADSLAVYDEDISFALTNITADYPNLPLFLMGHSTGGLIATLWANRHPGTLHGLVLNSAWLELQSMAMMRPAIAQVVTRISTKHPMTTVMTSKNDFYWRSLTQGWQGSDLPIPEEVAKYPEDPALIGWPIFPQWKHPISYPVPASWLRAILAGQEDVEKNVHLDIPVLSLTSTASDDTEEWSASYFDHDVVLDVDLIQERAHRLADLVTLARFPGKHDLTLSDPPVRAQLYSVINKWFKAVLD